ncbi:MAG: polymerase [Spirochaetaceae bacterium]|nr:polymerase [Spirochaetaceae bacterium]
MRSTLISAIALAAGFLFFYAGTELYGAENSGMSVILDWVNMKINVSCQLELKKLGLNLPAGRTQAENSLFGEYNAKIKNFMYSISVDSSSVMSDLIEHGELSPAAIDDIVLNAKNIPPTLSVDMQRISSSHSITLNEISSKLIKHSAGVDFEHKINPPAVPSFTGIIIIADKELPIHGRYSGAYLQPCLFPKIWDTEMNLVYDKKFADPDVFHHSTLVHYADSGTIFKMTPSGLSPELEKIVGSKPLKIIARGVFGIRPTDPIIDIEDATLILASESNRNLLRQGRVVFISSTEVLQTEYSGL